MSAAGQVWRTRALGSTAAGSGPGCMAAYGDEAPPCMRWRGLASPRRLAYRLLGSRWLRGPHRCQNPAVRASRPALPAVPGFPWGRIPSSVVRDFYCQPAVQHKAFPPHPQDSLAIHRTSVVYPLCTTGFHRPIHSCVHSLGENCRRSPAASARLTPPHLLASMVGCAPKPDRWRVPCQVSRRLRMHPLDLDHLTG